MLDIPPQISVTHKIDAKDVTVKLSVYDAEKKTLFGAPIAGVIAVGVFAAAVAFIFVRKKVRK